MITDHLQDSQRERSAPSRELKRMKFSETSEDFDNIVLQNQQLIMAATEAAKSAAYTVNQLSEILKAVLPAVVPQAGRIDPDPAPVGRAPPAPPPSTSRSQPEEQREPIGSNEIPENYQRSWNDQPAFFLQTAPTYAPSKRKIGTGGGDGEFLKENPLRYPSGCRPFSSCVTWSELDETRQRANEAAYTWHITFCERLDKT